MRSDSWCPASHLTQKGVCSNHRRHFSRASGKERWKSGSMASRGRGFTRVLSVSIFKSSNETVENKHVSRVLFNSSIREGTSKTSLKILGQTQTNMLKLLNQACKSETARNTKLAFSADNGISMFLPKTEVASFLSWMCLSWCYQ